MRTGIHPEYKKTLITCACGRVSETRSTVDELHVEICSHCHPFFTGRQKLVDTAGRVERFRAKYGDGSGQAPEAEESKDPEMEAATEPEIEAASEPEIEAASEPEVEAASEPEMQAASEPVTDAGAEDAPSPAESEPAPSPAESEDAPSPAESEPAKS